MFEPRQRVNVNSDLDADMRLPEYNTCGLAALRICQCLFHVMLFPLRETRA